jgi:hypothetical protein
MLLAFALTLLFAQPTNVSAHADSDLDRISEKIQAAISKTMPEWKCRRGEPFTGKDSVVLISCRFCEVGVVVSVMRFASVDEAAKYFRDGARYDKDREPIGGLGEEGYARGFRNASFAFRRQNLTVSVSITADDMEGMEKTSRRFAEILSEAFKDWQSN